MSAHLRKRDWAVVECTQAMAEAFIASIHYAQGAPNTAVARHALVRRDMPAHVRGVALWLPPTRAAAVTVNAIDPGGVLALSRFCLDDSVPANGESFLLGSSMRLLDRHRWPTLLTYADTRQGHVGTIYHATNWTYLGLVPGWDAWVDDSGAQRGRKRGGRNLSADEMRAAGFTRVPPSPKHKFVHHKLNARPRGDALLAFDFAPERTGP